jgi:PadR family transcriptional regulator, regulatory protein PadR
MGNICQVPLLKDFQIALDKSFYNYYIVCMQCRENKNGKPLGEFEALVLMAILRLGENAYGMRVHQELETTARRRCSLGALYTTLDRLEEKGYLSSRIGEATRERGGRAKKYLRVEAAGSLALRQAYQASCRMAEGIEPILGGSL